MRVVLLLCLDFKRSINYECPCFEKKESAKVFSGVFLNKSSLEFFKNQRSFNRITLLFINFEPLSLYFPGLRFFESIKLGD